MSFRLFVYYSCQHSDLYLEPNIDSYQLSSFQHVVASYLPAWCPAVFNKPTNPEETSLLLVPKLSHAINKEENQVI